MLEKINQSADVKSLSLDQLPQLAEDIRSALITKASVCGGHLASNLGIVELTIALHYVFDFPKDRVVFDVSHQVYPHKMLSGRKSAFLDPREYNGVTGYSNPDESDCDQFALGHSSTSISLACGLAKERDLEGADENVIAVIGDSALDGGQAYEALNYAGEMNTGLIVVVNDNNMSIPENHGALCELLTELRRNNGAAKNNFFKALGFEYVFVKDGHNTDQIVEVLQKVKGTDHPVAVHVCTVKGKGYKFAEQDPERWHWAHPFIIETGERPVREDQASSAKPAENYGMICREYLKQKIKTDRKVVVVAASTPSGIAFDRKTREKAGQQYIDVGIAEQNAVTMAAGIAKRGGRPVFATLGTFFQRAYDQIENEVCLNRLPVTFIMTFASIFGNPDDSHCGLLDIAIFSHVPGLVFLAPANKQEFLAMLDWSLDQNKYPVAIRTPWTGVYYSGKPVPEDYSITRYHTVHEGRNVAILALGGFYYLGEKTTEVLKKQFGIGVTLINPRFISGIDEETLSGLKKTHQLVVTLEDGILSGGFGSKIAQYYAMSDMKVLNYGFGMEIPRRYDAKDMMINNRLEPEMIASDIVDFVQADAI